VTKRFQTAFLSWMNPERRTDMSVRTLNLLRVVVFLPCLATANELPAASNLLQNAGFESGQDQPDGWRTFSPSPRSAQGSRGYLWDERKSHSGRHSVCVQSRVGGLGMWQQVVEVEPGRVYQFSGYLAFERVSPRSRCGLQLVFRDANGRVLQFVNLPAHTGTREFALDFPAQLKVRAPAGAAQAEVNLLLAGVGKVWFDDLFFGPAPTGTIAGKVTSNGKPLPDVRVFIWGDPWGKRCEARTDADGRYRLTDVPVAFPRYIVLAEKDGYRTRPVGDVAVVADGTRTVNFELAPGDDPDDLRVKFGTLSLRQFTPPGRIPAGAVIPRDASGYPEKVRPYLQPDEYIESDHPAVVAQARELVETLPVTDRRDTRKVVWVIYEWVSKHIEHDGVYSEPPRGLNQPFRDVTSGIWQSISGEGWCWGRNFYDWCYRPHELLQTRAGICIEHAWLVSAMLRSLNIPARAAIGALEFWAQDAKGRGAWVHLSTTGGRTNFRQRGQLGIGFGGAPPEVRYSILSRPILHEDWNAKNKGLWRERHPWGERYEATERGYQRAKADLKRFAVTGQAPRGTLSRRPGRPPRGEPQQDVWGLFDLAVQRLPRLPRPTDCYEIHYSDITINLLTMGDQRILDVRFPMTTERPGKRLEAETAYWTNHPECVRRTWVERITNPPAEGVERWFHIEFDLTSLLARGK